MYRYFNTTLETNYHRKNNINMDKQHTLNSISDARDILESFDTSGAMTIGFDQNTSYTLTSEQLSKIAEALYLADCLIYDLQD